MKSIEDEVLVYKDTVDVMQKKFDDETAARKREDERAKAEAAAAEQKVREREEAKRRAAEERAREARRNQMAAGPPTCVIKPAMSDEDLAKCRGPR
jgi:hypothetical protein